MTLTLQDVAGGRFLLGVGSGWLEEEFDALGVPFDDRAARMDETLAILRAAWSGDVFSHDGPLFSFGKVQLSPAPVDVPLILGGNTERALRRAADRRRRLVQLGDTLVRGRRRGSATGSSSCATLAGKHGEFPIYVRVAHPDPADLARYEAEGFEHVLVWADELWPRTRRPGREAAGVRCRGRRPRRRTTPRTTRSCDGPRLSRVRSRRVAFESHRRDQSSRSSTACSGQPATASLAAVSWPSGTSML